MTIMNDLLDVQIDNYEGPLDLLIYLIQRNEMNIFDVPISAITEQFVQEVRRMQSMDMEVAAEFIHMASYLIHLKSRSLLPRGTTVGEEISVEEEGFNLVQALAQLAYCKDLAAYLDKLFKVSGRYLLRRDELMIDKHSRAEVGTPYQLAQAFYGINTEKKEEKVVINSTKRYSDDIKIQTATILLERTTTMWSELESVFTDPFEKAIAFSTILTMSKQNFIRSLQEGNFSEIFMRRLKEAAQAKELLSFDD